MDEERYQMNRDTERSLNMLPPDMQLRITSHIDYHPYWDPTEEIFVSQEAMKIVNTLQSEAQILFIRQEGDYDVLDEKIPDLGEHSVDTIDRSLNLALYHIRNPISVKEIVIG